MKDLKHKNLIILSAISVLAIVSVLVATNMNTGTVRDETLLASARIDPAAFLVDSSGDGMYDWEKSLWGLNPILNDNSGDGIPDVEKIRAGKDPRLVAPNDELREENIPIYLRTYEDPNKTQDFTQEFFAGFRALAYSGNLNNDTLGELMKYLSGELNLESEGGISEVATVQKFSLSDLSTTDSSREQMKKYGNDLGKLFIKYSSEATANEFEILVRSIEAGELLETEKFENVLRLYNEAIVNLMDMSVPSSVAGEHLNVANALNEVKTAIQNASESILADPISVMLSLREYQGGLYRFSESANSIKKLLLESFVYYKENEPGYIFLHQSL